MDEGEVNPQQEPEPFTYHGNGVTILEARLAATEERGPFREDSRVWHLSDPHFVAIVEWILLGISAKKIAKLCERELGLPPSKVPGKDALSDFWSVFSLFWWAARRRANRKTVEALDTRIKEEPMEVDATLRDEIKQRAFELLQQPNPPEQLVKAFLNAVLKMRDQDDRKEQRELDREKFAAVQRTKVEEGLEALRKEIKDNPGALAAWEQLKGTLQPV
jgi:hypothetical protein